MSDPVTVPPWANTTTGGIPTSGTSGLDSGVSMEHTAAAPTHRPAPEPTVFVVRDIPPRSPQTEEDKINAERLARMNAAKYGGKKK